MAVRGRSGARLGVIGVRLPNVRPLGFGLYNNRLGRAFFARHGLRLWRCFDTLRLALFARRGRRRSFFRCFFLRGLFTHDHALVALRAFGGDCHKSA